MELFVAATGCLDPEVASFYLECAGHDPTRAVNHFFDSPLSVASDGATFESGGKASSAHGASSAGAAVGVAKRSSSIGCSASTTRKRQRVPGATGQQDLLMFRHAKPLPEDACGPPSDIEHLEREAALKQGASSEAPHGTAAASTTATATAAGAAAPSTAAVAPSAEWTEAARRCQREGVLFEDDRFRPRPSSLDGRPGKGSAASQDDEHGGGAEKRGREDAEDHVRCKCSMRAKVVTVSKAGANQGRLFYGCVTRACNFFKWADDAPHTRQALSLVWRRFSPPRFKLSAVSEGGGDAGCGFKPQDIRQGAVGDCWFLAGLAVISERPDLIARVLGGNGPISDNVGCFEVNLFKDGRWESVLVDSWLPCKDPSRLKGKEKGLDHLPAFAKASNNQIWPCIVEKAFAKQHGSYEAISGGHVCEAFEALTGAPTETVMLDDDDSEANWAKMLSFSQAEFPMGCATSWDPSSGLRDMGLVSTHAYSVLEVRELPPGLRGARQPSIRDWAGLGSAAAAAEKARQREGEAAGQPLRLVRVRNPWGKREWTGDWSDKSEKWSDSVRRELGWSEKNDGTFWMTWQDFMTRFELVDVCKARRSWGHASVATQVLPGLEGFSSFRIRPPTKCGERDTSTTWAYLTVVQPTKRGRKDSYWYRALGLLVTEVGDPGGGNGSNENTGTMVAACLGGSKRSVSCEVFLKSGRAYMASVVCLSAEAGRLRWNTSPDVSLSSSSAFASGPPTPGFQGFRVMAYSAHPVQVIPAEMRPEAVGYFRVGPSLHQALLRRCLGDNLAGSAEEADRGRVESFALCRQAALVLVPAGNSAVFFVLMNAGSTEVALDLTITSLEGGTVRAPTPTSDSNSVWAKCLPSSQKIVLVLARTADYGTFRHAFCYRVTPPARSRPPPPPRSPPQRSPRPPSSAATESTGEEKTSRQEPRSAPAMGMRAECTGSGSLRPGVQCPPRQQTQQQQQQKAGDEQTFVDLCGSSGDEEEEKGQTLVQGSEMAESASTRPPSAVAAAGCSGRVTAVSTSGSGGGGVGGGGGGGGGGIRGGVGGVGGGNVHASASAAASRGKGSDRLDGGGGNVEDAPEKRGAGLFAAQQLLPVAEVVVRRAHDALLTTGGCVSGQALIEGYGGGTVGEGERGIGSAPSARHD